ncbi:MAG: hypothetical protein KH382_06425 [Clostridiales bacterium]|nr:hypothetical protein [Clostridiales bacterium]
MFIYDAVFKNDEEIRAFVSEAEEKYKTQILKIADHIKNTPDVRFLTLAGPTCSGKTTTSYILEHELGKCGITVKIVSIDDFYRDRDDISDDEKPDYESISAIDFEVFTECIAQILSGKTAYLPKFDFQLGHRTEFVPYTPAAHEIVIFEGIQAIYPEIVATLPKDLSKSIYISVDDDVTAYGTFFDKREVRFLRRLVRDFLFRNATPERTLELWSGVIANEDKNIIPYGHHADFIINSFLQYELGVIKPFVLETIRYDFNKKCEIELYEKLKSKFEKIPTIPEKFVPADSVFREFIGSSRSENENSI